MSSEDLPVEVVEEDPLSDLPPFPGEEEEQGTVEPSDDAAEETVVSETEEATEASEGSEEISPEDVDGGPDLSQFPEDMHDSVRAFAQFQGDQRVSKLESNYTAKLQDAAAQQKLLEEYDRAITERPDLVMEELKKLIDGGDLAVPETPQEPGPMPSQDEIYDNPAALTEWIAKRDEYRDWQTEQMIASQRQETEKRLQPLLERDRQIQAYERDRAIQQGVGADDETFSEMKLLANDVMGDPGKAWKLIKEVVSLRKTTAGKTATRRSKVEEQIRGSEERPGLPGTGARKPAPRPTGNLTADIAASLEADGVEFPEGH